MDWIKENLDFEIDNLKANLNLVSSKDKNVEWKRDHYRYTFTVTVQRIYHLLSTSITEIPPSPPEKSTREELKILRSIINEMLI